MYIDSLEVTNFRCYEHAAISFQYSKPRAHVATPKFRNLNLILGDNGTGKSAILRGLTLAVLGRIIHSTGYRPYYLVRRKGTEAEQQEDGKKKLNAEVRARIVLHAQDGEDPSSDWNARLPGILTGQATVTRLGDIETVSSTAQVNPQRWEPMYNDYSPGFFLVAYGAGRRVEAPETFDTSARNRTYAPRYQRIASLFEDTASLTPANAWWSELGSKGRRKEGLDVLNDLLPEEVRVTASSRSETDIMFSFQGTALPFSALSDGYRAFLSWTMDLLYQMSQVMPREAKFGQLRGVVIVDEIDLLLHPDWQQTVVESLANTFPRLQFFFTTHSPIVTGTLEAANILRTEIDPETGFATITKSQERVHGLSADQILDSQYFGIASSRAPDTERRLRDLTERTWRNDKDAAVEYLRLLANGDDTTGKDKGTKSRL